MKCILYLQHRVSNRRHMIGLRVDTIFMIFWMGIGDAYKVMAILK